MSGAVAKVATGAHTPSWSPDGGRIAFEREGVLLTRRLVAAYVLLGIGLGFVNAPITNTAVSGMPRAQAGVAAAIATTSRQVGQTLGVAGVGAVGAGASWWLLTACGGVVLALGLVATTQWARRTAFEEAAVVA